MMLLCWFALYPLLETDLDRITYELEIIEGNRQVSARLVLNQAGPDLFSIHCAKSGAGAFFTYWATPEQNTLYVPRWNLAFVGAADAPFRLFPKGPELTREVWFKLLFGEPPALGEAFLISDEAGWRVLRNREAVLTLRWRERKRSQKSESADRVLKPSFEEGTQVEALAEIATYWEEF